MFRKQFILTDEVFMPVGESDYKKVMEVFVKETEVITHVFYEIQEEDREVRTEEIETILNHRFWSEGEWKAAGTLKAGDRLTLADGTQVEVTEVTFEDRHETVYNMEVADYHTYYVGEDGVWVHNMYGQQGGQGTAKDYGINIDDLEFSSTVQNHEARPYQNSKLLINEIIESKPPIPDPQGQPALYWEVEGSFNGSNGIYELVINPEDNVVWHFLYRSQ